MKRKLIVLCAVFSAIIGAFACFACGSKEDDHEHEFVDYAYNNDATCIADGTETAQCTKCSKKDTRVKAGTATGVHDYVDYVCSGCGKIAADAPATEGLKFTEIIEDNKVVGYSVSAGSLSNGTTTYIKIPSEYEGKPVTEIARNAFSSFYHLPSVSIPSSVTTIDRGAFYCCYDLVNITLPDSVTSVGASAFEACVKLETINIPDGVSILNSRTFYNCPELTNLTIPDSVTYIGGSVFFNCNKLVQNDGGVYYIDKWIVACDPSVSTVTLRADTVGIAAFAIQSCKNLTSLVLPEKVKSICYASIDGCSSLTSITIPKSVTYMDESTITNCNKDLIIYCEAEQQPDGWKEKWNYNNRTVQWGYKNSNG